MPGGIPNIKRPTSAASSRFSEDLDVIFAVIEMPGQSVEISGNTYNAINAEQFALSVGTTEADAEARLRRLTQNGWLLMKARWVGTEFKGYYWTKS